MAWNVVKGAFEEWGQFEQIRSKDWTVGDERNEQFYWTLLKVDTFLCFPLKNPKQDWVNLQKVGIKIAYHILSVRRKRKQ
jgi:hypothetical protein